jgi:hypothetical protein
MNNPSSYVKAGAGRGAGTILPNTDLSGVLAREGQIMQQGAAKMQKMAQLQQEAKKIDDTKWDAIKPVIDKVWMEADGETYKVDRDKFQNYVVDVKNKYGMWNKVPYDEQQKILKMRDELRDYAALSGEQREIYKSQFLKYTADKNKYDPKTKDLLMDYYKGGGLKSQKERADYRAKLIQDNGGLLIPKEERFDWKKELLSGIGSVGKNKAGEVRETNIEELVSSVNSTYLQKPKISEGIKVDLDNPDASNIKERYAYKKEALSAPIQKYFKEGDPYYNYALQTAYDRFYQKDIDMPRATSDGGGSGYTSADLVYEKADKTINVKYVYPGALKKRKADEDYEYQAGDYQNFQVPIQGSIDFGKEIKNVALQAKEVFDPGTGRIEKNIYGNINGKIVGIVKVKGIDDELFVNVESKDVGTIYVPYSELRNKFQNIQFGKKQGYSLADEVERLLLGTATTAITKKKPKPY